MHNVLPPVDSGSSWCDSRSMGLLQPGSSFHTLIPRFPSQKHRTRPISRVLGPATARASQPRPTGEDCLGALHAPDAVPERLGSQRLPWRESWPPNKQVRYRRRRPTRLAPARRAPHPDPAPLLLPSSLPAHAVYNPVSGTALNVGGATCRAPCEGEGVVCRAQPIECSGCVSPA